MEASASKRSLLCSMLDCHFDGLRRGRGLISNVGGPRASKIRLVMSPYATLLYGAKVWAQAIKVKKYCKRDLAVQRSGDLSASRTVSASVAMVVAGVVPINLLVVERRNIISFVELGGSDAVAVGRKPPEDLTAQVRLRRGGDMVAGNTILIGTSTLGRHVAKD